MLIRNALLLILAAAALLAEGVVPDGFDREGEGPLLLQERILSESGIAFNGTRHVEPYYAVLFPWFSELMGVIALYFISRYVHSLPYTAVLFVIGVFMGVAFQRENNSSQLMDSILIWVNINPELLLLVFLPGLLFGDALQVNFHMFSKGFLQLLWLAFIGTLFGTIVTALIVYYVFPYDWNFYLCLTLGSILGATDPVSVSSLLAEVGAPPRLRILIQGESMLNDGAAIVFFTIFSNMYLESLNIDGIGKSFTVGEGFAVFFQMSLGGAALGLAFGMMLIFVLWMLDRKLDAHDTVLQVVATITIAYLSYYVAEVVCHTSGVLAVVFCGIVTSAFGLPFFHNRETLENVWSAIEHLGNTLLFILGGVVFGALVSDNNVREDYITGTEWGWMICLYLFAILIRGLMVLLSFPLLVRIGLGVNKPEAVFMVHGGLRGAVGIALALVVDTVIREHVDYETDEGHQALQQSSRLFMFVGGVALMTLVINGTSSALVLRFLGLTSTSEARLQIIQCLHNHVKLNVLDKYVMLIQKERFSKCDFEIVKHHVEIIRDVDEAELELAFKRVGVASSKPAQHSCSMDGLGSNHDNVEVQDVELSSGVLKHQSQSSPAENILPDRRKCILAREKSKRLAWQTTLPASKLATSLVNASMSHRRINRFGTSKATGKDLDSRLSLREVFIEQLRHNYWEQIKSGEMPAGGFIDYALLQSLELASDKVARGYPLEDWDYVNTVNNSIEARVEGWTAKLCSWGRRKSASITYESRMKRDEIFKALFFIKAHKNAEHEFKIRFGVDGALSAAEQCIVDESEVQVAKARKILEGAPCELLRTTLSHLVCTILLNYEAEEIKTLKEQGVLKDKESQVLFKQVTKEMRTLHYCSGRAHESNENSSSCNTEQEGEDVKSAGAQTVAFA